MAFDTHLSHNPQPESGDERTSFVTASQCEKRRERHGRIKGLGFK